MDKINAFDVIFSWPFLIFMLVIMSPFILWFILHIIESLPRKQVFVCLECKRNWAERHWSIRYGYKRQDNNMDTPDLVSPTFDQGDAGFRAALWLEQNRKV